MPVCRPMQLTDIPAVVMIERAVQSHPWTEKLFVEGLQSGHLSTVLTDHNQVIGFCILQKVLDEANLLLMAIAPQQQGKGLGSQLLNASLAALGDKTSVVFLEVRESNMAAQRLYEKAGFSQIDLRKNYYPTASGKEHAVIMALTLHNPFA